MDRYGLITINLAALIAFNSTMSFASSTIGPEESMASDRHIDSASYCNLVKTKLNALYDSSPEKAIYDSFHLELSHRKEAAQPVLAAINRIKKSLSESERAQIQKFLDGDHSLSGSGDVSRIVTEKYNLERGNFLVETADGKRTFHLNSNENGEKSIRICNTEITDTRRSSCHTLSLAEMADSKTEELDHLLKSDFPEYFDPSVEKGKSRSEYVAQRLSEKPACK